MTRESSISGSTGIVTAAPPKPSSINPMKIVFGESLKFIRGDVPTMNTLIRRMKQATKMTPLRPMSPGKHGTTNVPRMYIRAGRAKKIEIINVSSEYDLRWSANVGVKNPITV